MLPRRIDCAGDEIKSQRRTRAKRAKLQAGIVKAVRLSLRVVSVNQHDLRARTAGQSARLVIDRITERLDRAADSFARFRPDVLDIVEHPRHGDPRHSGLFGDVVDCGVSPAHARKVASV